jgi:sulfide:quinone oxidoreductase
MTEIIIVGGNFAGLTSALELKRKLGKECHITVISKSPDFLFTPSLIWVPFGKRSIADISIPLEPILSKAQIKFICAEVTQIRPEARIVQYDGQEANYDYLVIATGPQWLFDQVEGLGLESNISFIVTPQTALQAFQRWQRLLENPGPAVIGVAPGAQCSGPAYEYLFIFEKFCRDSGIRKKVDITFFTPEPYLGHLGIGGLTGSRFFLRKLFPMFNINYLTNAELQKVTDENIILKNGQSLPYRFSMIMPMYHGASLVKVSEGLGNESGFLPINNGYQHKVYPNIFGIGAAADSLVRLKTPVAIGVPKTGYAADESARTAAENITRLVNGKNKLKLKPMSKMPALCILDAGDKEMVAIGDSLLKPRKFSITIPNPFYDVGKMMFEKYYLWKVKQGLSWLP